MKAIIPFGLVALCSCAQFQPDSHPREADCHVAAEAMAGIMDGRIGQASPQMEGQSDQAAVLIRTPEQVLNDRMMDWDQRATARPTQPARTERERAYYNNQLIVTYAYSLNATSWLPRDRAQAVDAYVRDCKSGKIKVWSSKEATPPVADLI